MIEQLTLDHEGDIDPEAITDAGRHGEANLAPDDYEPVVESKDEDERD